jgi:autoinducer 2-degrading protein
MMNCFRLRECRAAVSFEVWLEAPNLRRMITVTVIVNVDPARVDFFLECARDQAAASQKEPGCRRFAVSQKLDEAHVFTFQEEFVDEAALQAHYDSPHFTRWKERTGEGLIVSRRAARGRVIS